MAEYFPYYYYTTNFPATIRIRWPDSSSDSTTPSAAIESRRRIENGRFKFAVRRSDRCHKGLFPHCVGRVGVLGSRMLLAHRDKPRPEQVGEGIRDGRQLVLQRVDLRRHPLVHRLDQPH